MQCPKCRHNNSDEVKVCRYCNSALPDRDALSPKPQAKTSKLTILSLVLGILSLFFFVLTSIPAIIIGIISYCRIKYSSGKLKGRFFAILSIIISVLFMFVFFTFWRLDAPPIPNDYTINDIRSAAPEYNQTYDILHSLADMNENLLNAPAIGLTIDDVQQIEEISKLFKEDYQSISQKHLEYEESILLIWKNAKKGRDVLAKLNSFPEIADITEPQLTSNFPWIYNFRRLVFLHRAYICLQSCKGNHKAAIDELIKFDSLCKKISLNARSVIMKLICIACLDIQNQTANFMINNPDTPDEILLLIQKHIVPVSEEYTSLQNVIKFEYLSHRKQYRIISTGFTNNPRLRYSIYSPFKYNSTLRLNRNLFDEMIALEENKKVTKKLKVWPIFFPNLFVELNHEDKLPWYYRIYNITGSSLTETTMPVVKKVTNVKTRMDIRSDMLEIVLNKRLGKDVDLNSRAYSNEYIIDIKNKIIFNPGPDGESGTKDDIKLPINPQVLGLLDN